MVEPKKRGRGRPTTGGRDPLLTTRAPAEIIAAIEAWAKSRELSRSEAIRRLVEIGLKADRPAGRPSPKAAARAAELAAKIIDRHIAGASDADVRKRRILKGPSVFRGVRKD